MSLQIETPENGKKYPGKNRTCLGAGGHLFTAGEEKQSIHRFPAAYWEAPPDNRIVVRLWKGRQYPRLRVAQAIGGRGGWKYAGRCGLFNSPTAR